MKRVYAYLSIVAIGVFTLASCSSDDNTPVAEPNHLLGKWKLNTMSMTSSEDGVITNQVIDLPVGFFLTMEFDFKEDNTVAYYISIPMEEREEEGVGTYQKDGDNLILGVGNEGTETFLILKNDAENLHLGLHEEWEYDGIIYEEEIEQKFIRM